MSTPERKLICLSLDERSNGLKLKATERCSDERVPNADYCARHLAEAHRQYVAILAAFAVCIGRECQNERAEGFEWCEEHLAEIARRWAEQVARDVEEGNTQ